MITALTALALEAYPSVRTGDGSQPEMVRSILTGAALDLGLPRTVQGFGLPQAMPALGSAAATSLQNYWYFGVA
jgi:hypothetical protein